MKVKINKQYFVLPLIAAITFIIMMSCKEETNITESNSKESKNLSKDIGIDRIIPFVKERISGEFDHYEAKPGKIFGVWPHDDRKNPNGFNELRNKWGFNYIFYQHSNSLPNQFNQILQAGYSRNNIMAGISEEWHQFIINTYPNLYAYNMDEGRHRGWSYNGIREFINANSPGSYFIIGDYCPINWELSDWVWHSDYIMYSAYEHFTQIFDWCLDIGYDQISGWNGFKAQYGNKSIANWISTQDDQDEYRDLLRRARNLGLTGV